MGNPSITISRCLSVSSSSSFRLARKPPMFARPSFLALMVQPSAWLKISRTISATVLCPCPFSRCLMNQAFSAKRQASM